jgi:hypothetical protein
MRAVTCNREVTQVGPSKGASVQTSLAVITASGVLGIGLTIAGLGGAPRAAAGPDAQCQDPAFTTAIVFPANPHSPMVACVPVSVVDHYCHAPLGEPHTILYPLGQGPAPACRSIYSPN